MKKFEYKAKTKEGRTVKGIVEVKNEKDAIKLLRTKELITLSLKPKEKSDLLSFLSVLQGVSSSDVAELTRQLSTMINAGLALTDGLTILRDQSKPAVSRLLGDVIRDVEGGSSLHAAFSKYPRVFSKIYLSLIKSGELAGSLDKVLARLSDNLEKTQEFKSKIKGALIYPAIVVVGMIVVAFIMMVYVIPKLTEMYEEFGTTLPLPTQILIFVSRFTTRYWFIVIAGFIGLIYVLYLWKKTPLGREQIDSLKLRMPIIGPLTRNVILTDITRTLSMLVTAGVSIIEALNTIAEGVNNAVFEKSLSHAAKQVEKGLPLASVLERFEEYPPIVSQMTAVGEETGKLDEVLMRVSRYFELQSEVAIKGLTSAIEPIMMVLLGLGVGFLVMAIIMPIYNLTSQF